MKLSNRIDHTSLPVGNYSEDIDEDGKLIRTQSENFDFFNYAGLNRYVRLISTPRTYIEDIVIAYDVDLEKSNAELHVTTKVNGESGDLRIAILDEENRVVARGEGADSKIFLENITLWEPMSSYLYKARVELIKDNEALDVYEEDFGIRTIEVKGTELLINGKPFYFKGFGKHEDTYINGRGINEAYNVADINLMKWMGANSFRTSHYPYSEEMMRLCDREGIVVIDECAAVGMFEGFNVNSAAGMGLKSTWEHLDTSEAHEQGIRELIERDKNHACVVMWSLMN